VLANPQNNNVRVVR